MVPAKDDNPKIGQVSDKNSHHSKHAMFHTHASFHRRPYLALLVSDESSHHFDNSILRNRSLVFFQNLEIRQVSDKSSHHPENTLEGRARVETHKRKLVYRIPPSPNFNVGQCARLLVRTSVRKMPAPTAFTKQSTLK